MSSGVGRERPEPLRSRSTVGNKRRPVFGRHRARITSLLTYPVRISASTASTPFITIIGLISASVIRSCGWLPFATAPRPRQRLQVAAGLAAQPGNAFERPHLPADFAGRGDTHRREPDAAIARHLGPDACLLPPPSFPSHWPRQLVWRRRESARECWGRRRGCR